MGTRAGNIGWVAGASRVFAVVALAVAWIFCAPSDAMTFLQDGNGYWWDFQADGSVNDGSPTPQETVDAFDDAMRLAVNGETFPEAPQTTAMGGRMLVTGPVMMSGLRVTRRAYVPNTPGQGWACFLEYFQNQGSTNVTVTVRVFGNLGSDSATAATATSSGDAVFTPQDRWVASDDQNNGAGDPSLNFNYWGAGAAVTPSAVFLPASQEDYYVDFAGVNVPPNTTVILMHFCGQNANDAAAATNAQYLDGLPAAALAGLNAADYGPVINWNIHDNLTVMPHMLLIGTGLQGGGFSPSPRIFTLTNTGPTALGWDATWPDWVDLAPENQMSLGAGQFVLVQMTYNALANTFSPGVYTDSVVFTDTASGARIVRNVQLVVNERMAIAPDTGLVMDGFQGGPFAPPNATYTLNNAGAEAVQWSAAGPAWLDIAPNSGTLMAHASAQISVASNAATAALPPGVHSEALRFANHTYATEQTRDAQVTVRERLGVTPADRFVSRGLQGGPFVPTETAYTLRNLSSDQAITWSAPDAAMPDWLTVTPNTGTLAPNESVQVAVQVNAEAEGLAANDYADTIGFHNDTYGSTVARDVLLRVKNVVFVDKSATGPTYDGASWASAFKSIQPGINAADASNAWVWVADGMYNEEVVMTDGVEVYGGFHGNPLGETALAQRDPSLNVATINGLGAGTVVVFDAIADSGIDGFTITGGNATGAAPLDSGGGIRCNGTNDTNFIRGCTIRENRVMARGAGIYCLAGATIPISGCTIYGNEGTMDFAGGIACWQASPRIEGCLICNNTNRYGAGVGCIESSPTVLNCIISGNVAASPGGGSAGGGIFAHFRSSPIVVNCLISGNMARDWGGGAVMCQAGCNPVLTNCTISSNYCNVGGGGVQAIAGSPSNPPSVPVITNCILDHMVDYALFNDAVSNDVVSHCLFYANSGGDYAREGSSTYTGGEVINAQVAGAHDNVAADPSPRFSTGPSGTWILAPVYDVGTNRTTLTTSAGLLTPHALRGKLINANTTQTRHAYITDNTDRTITFVGDITKAGGPLGYVEINNPFQVLDYHLSNDSPAVNTGDNAAPNAGTTDVEGNPRIADAVVDLGAYECSVAGGVTVDSIHPAGNPVTNQEVVCFEIRFSRAVTHLSTSDFAVVGSGAQAGATVIAVTGSDYRWTACVDTASGGNGSLHLDLVDHGTLTDIIGYPLAGGDYTAGTDYYVDYLKVTLRPQDADVPTGASHDLVVAAADGAGTLHYKWKRNGIVVPQAPDSATWTLDNVTSADSGAYSCEISDDYTSVTSDAAIIYVIPNLPATGMIGLVALTGILAAGAVRHLKNGP